MDIVKSDQINRLYDLYQNLLTKYQQTIFELYYQEDFSLKEIADLKKVSRNAVFTLLKRVTNTLEKYEEKLQLLSKNNRIFEVLETCDDIKLAIAQIKDILE